MRSLTTRSLTLLSQPWLFRLHNRLHSNVYRTAIAVGGTNIEYGPSAAYSTAIQSQGSGPLAGIKVGLKVGLYSLA